MYANEELDVDEVFIPERKKGTSYNRKKEDYAREAKRNKKKSNRLASYGDSGRARGKENLRNYLAMLDEEDF